MSIKTSSHFHFEGRSQTTSSIVSKINDNVKTDDILTIIQHLGINEFFEYIERVDIEKCVCAIDELVELKQTQDYDKLKKHCFNTNPFIHSDILDKLKCFHNNGFDKNTTFIKFEKMEQNLNLLNMSFQFFISTTLDTLTNKQKGIHLLNNSMKKPIVASEDTSFKCFSFGEQPIPFSNTEKFDSISVKPIKKQRCNK